MIHDTFFPENAREMYQVVKIRNHLFFVKENLLLWWHDEANQTKAPKEQTHRVMARNEAIQT